jgi:hypothetical protein
MTIFDSEKQREANIAKNRALLAQLDLKEAGAGLGFPASKPKPQKGAKPVQPSQSRKRKAAEPLAPRRQSSRLKKPVVDPNETPEQRRKREVCTLIVERVTCCWIAVSASLDGGRGTARSRARRTN